MATAYAPFNRPPSRKGSRASNTSGDSQRSDQSNRKQSTASMGSKAPNLDNASTVSILDGKRGDTAQLNASFDTEDNDSDLGSSSTLSTSTPTNNNVRGHFRSGAASIDNPHDVDEELKVPIIGYEVMESRAKFTVYKINVQRGADESWFVFRRYTDFVRLNEKLKKLFPSFRLSLPPKRWFRDNFEHDFLEDRLLGLQAFMTNVTSHRDIRNSSPVKEFFCLEDPPGPHDSLEESRTLCDNLDAHLHELQEELEDRAAKINLLETELDLYKTKVETLETELRQERLRTKKRRTSPTGSNNDASNRNSMISTTSSYSLAECDIHTYTEAEQAELDKNRETARIELAKESSGEVTDIEKALTLTSLREKDKVMDEKDERTAQNNTSWTIINTES